MAKRGKKPKEAAPKEDEMQFDEDGYPIGQFQAGPPKDPQDGQAATQEDSAASEQDTAASRESQDQPAGFRDGDLKFGSSASVSLASAAVNHPVVHTIAGTEVAAAVGSWTGTNPDSPAQLGEALEKLPSTLPAPVSQELEELGELVSSWASQAQAATAQTASAWDVASSWCTTEGEGEAATADWSAIEAAIMNILGKIGA